MAAIASISPTEINFNILEFELQEKTEEQLRKEIKRKRKEEKRKEKETESNSSIIDKEISQSQEKTDEQLRKELKRKRKEEKRKERETEISVPEAKQIHLENNTEDEVLSLPISDPVITSKDQELEEREIT